MASETEKRTKFKDYTPFHEAATKRTPQARWDGLFAERQNDIVLPLGEASVGNETSLEARINSLYTQVKQEHNTHSGHEKPIPAVKLSEDKKQILNAETGKLLINTGRFLREHDWALFDDWNRAMSTGQEEEALTNALTDTGHSLLEYDSAMFNDWNRAISTNAKSASDAPEEVAHSAPVECDHIDPSRLRVIISRAPEKLAEMSTGQRWWSCMNEEHRNHQYVSQDIEHGTLVAYVVMEGDEAARYPLMRQLLKPYRDTRGKTILVPAKIYGGNGIGNAETREKLKACTTGFVQEKVNHDAKGTYTLVNGLYADGEATQLQAGETAMKVSLAQAMAHYIPGALKEFRTELRRDDRSEHDKDKIRKKVRQLIEPKGLAEQYFRVLRRSARPHASIILQLPSPKMILTAATLPEVSKAIAEVRPRAHLTLGDIDRLRDALEGWTKLSLNNGVINAAEAAMLAKALATNTTLRALNVRYNNIGAEGAKALAANTTLRALNVRYNNIGAEGAKALAANTTLTSLNVSNNQIGAEGAKALAGNTSLRTLNVKGNDIGAEGAKALAANTTLTSLNVEDCDIGYNEGTAILHAGLKNNLNLLVCEGVYGELEDHCRKNHKYAERWLTRLTHRGSATLSGEESNDLSRRKNAVLHLAEKQGREEEISAVLDRIFPPGRTVDVMHASRLTAPASGMQQAF